MGLELEPGQSTQSKPGMATVDDRVAMLGLHWGSCGDSVASIGDMGIKTLINSLEVGL